MKRLSGSERDECFILKSVYSVLAAVLLILALFPAESLAFQDERGRPKVYIVMRTDNGSNLPGGVGFKFHPYTIGSTYYSQFIVSGNTTKSPHKLIAGEAKWGDRFLITAVTVPGYTAKVWPRGAVAFRGRPIEFTVTFKRVLDCTLAVNIEPDDGPGSFSISGPVGFIPVSGQTSNYSSKVPSGKYTVAFTTAQGFDLAINTTSLTVSTNSAFGTLSSGDAETVTGVYSKNQGILNVNIEKNGGPGSFSISGPSGFTPLSGQTSNYSAPVPIGAYTVTFATTPGFDLDVSATSFTVGTNSASGTIEGGASETVEGVYTEHTGKLQGFIEPIAAETNGGMWRLKNASGWRDSGNIAEAIPIGTYIVEFKAIDGWTKPSDATVIISKGTKTTLTGYYTDQTIRGSLQVFISNNTNRDIINEGAKWRPIYPDSVGPSSNNWYESGHTIAGLPVGSAEIEFKLVNGYILPDMRRVIIKPEKISQVTGEYIRPLIIHKCDYDGNGTEDLPVFNRNTRMWSVASVATAGPAAMKTILEQKFGKKDDIPVTGDYDGDGVADLAVYREKTGKWIVHRLFTINNFGEEGDIPVPGDYFGDGTTDPALYRPGTGEWLIHHINIGVRIVVNFGGPGYIPVPGNYDGDKKNKTDLGIYHVQSGQWKVAVYQKNNYNWTEREKYREVFGNIGDIPVQGDYDGNGTTDFAYYDRTDNIWHVLDQFEIKHGKRGVIPVPNDWAGLGRIIPAYFNPKTGRWQAVDNLLRAKFGAGARPLVSGR